MECTYRFISFFERWVFSLVSLGFIAIERVNSVHLSQEEMSCVKTVSGCLVHSAFAGGGEKPIQLGSRMDRKFDFVHESISATLCLSGYAPKDV